MKKKRLLITLGALAAVAGPAGAQSINVTVDGDIVAFGAQRPVQRFGTVLVPLRGVFEKLGASVQYDGASKSILAVKGATNVQLRLGEARAQVNGNERVLSVPAQAVNGTTLVPLRFVSEALGAGVKWRPASRTVVISTTGDIGSEPDPVATTGNSGAVEVTSFTHDANRALRGGEVITATLRGTPGGSASFSIPGIQAAKSVAMRETSPGVYSGAFTVPNGLNVRGATLLASLKRGGASSPVIQAGEALTVDAAGPQFGNLSPAINASLPPGKPLVYGTYSDAGTGIAENATRVLVNGKDVTGDATVTEAFFSYRPGADLPAGKNTASVIARDRAGNESRKDWAFTISANETLIKSVSVTPEARTLEPGDVVTVRLEAAPGGSAKFSIGGAVTGRPMAEQSPGVYAGTYTVKKGDSLAKAPASVTFTSASGRTVTQSADQSVTIAAGAPGKPTITTPEANASVGGRVTATGKAAPGATVRYSLKYQGVLIVLPAGGTIAEGEVKANAQGKWTTPEIQLSAPLGVSRLSYTLEAVTVGAADGETSEPASVQFKR